MHYSFAPSFFVFVFNPGGQVFVFVGSLPEVLSPPFFSFLMTDAHAAPCEDPYRDGEAWRHPPVPPPRPGAWPASGEVVEQHTWPDAGAATASAAPDRGGAGVTASACVRTPVFSKASICIDAL